MLTCYKGTRSSPKQGTSNIPLRNTAANRFPFSNFKYSFTLFSKFFASFLHSTCSLSVSCPYLVLDGIYHPLRAAFPSNSTRRKRAFRRTLPRIHGVLTLHDAPFHATLRSGPTGHIPSDYNSHIARPWWLPTWTLPASLAVTRGILVSVLSSAY